MERVATFQPVDLAREEDFMLGALRVRPSRGEVEAAGERRDVERRVMQVLVALARPTWEVVSPEELIARCWGGLAVTDDAIHRCIRSLRRLAASWAQPPFEIETIHRIGYFLQPIAQASEAPPALYPNASTVVRLDSRAGFHRAA
jgi:DNA-binding winged helix-turn-helix (wHTH) protein